MTAELARPIVPPYLIELLQHLDRDDLGDALASNNAERELVRLAIDAESKLSEWSDDSQFWNSMSRFIASPGAVTSEPIQMDRRVDFAELLDDEVEIAILSNALQGHDQLANTVLLEAPTFFRPITNPQVAENVKEAVVQINVKVTVALNAPPTQRRPWRLAKTLRRVFKAAAGGILIAADVFVPDPTLSVRVASVAGGIDMILDAAESIELSNRMAPT